MYLNGSDVNIDLDVGIECEGEGDHSETGRGSEGVVWKVWGEGKMGIGDEGGMGMEGGSEGMGMRILVGMSIGTGIGAEKGSMGIVDCAAGGGSSLQIGARARADEMRRISGVGGLGVGNSVEV